MFENGVGYLYLHIYENKNMAKEKRLKNLDLPI